MRHFRYHAYQVLRLRTGLIPTPLLRWFRKQMPTTVYDEIKIVDMALQQRNDQQFQVDIVAALDLIKALDPRRFQRIQKEIRFITNVEGLSWGHYVRPLRECRIDYACKAFSNPEWSRWCYATLLIHEATHGAIHSRHIAYTKSLRVRIERLCHTESTRFAKKADTEQRQWSTALVGGEFDERKWYPAWDSTFFQKIMQIIARFRKAYPGNPK